MSDVDVRYVWAKTDSPNAYSTVELGPVRPLSIPILD
jgi:hypothetical protein